VNLSPRPSFSLYARDVEAALRGLDPFCSGVWKIEIHRPSSSSRSPPISESRESPHPRLISIRGLFNFTTSSSRVATYLLTSAPRTQCPRTPAVFPVPPTSPSFFHFRPRPRFPTELFSSQRYLSVFPPLGLGQPATKLAKEPFPRRAVPSFSSHG